MIVKKSSKYKANEMCYPFVNKVIERRGARRGKLVRILFKMGSDFIE